MSTAAEIRPPAVDRRDYALVTLGYWAFTLTDGALRMLVLLHFHELGYSPVSLAFLFVLYEVTGIATNLLGGWVGTRTGLNRTLVAGLALQAAALVALTFHDVRWTESISVAFVMAVQAVSGVAKDLTKMSSKSTVKLVAGEGSLFGLVALLTGSKNALKGAGFFLGAALLAGLGYDDALLSMAGGLAVVLGAVVVLLRSEIGRAKRKPPLRSVFATSAAINRLSAARIFLFGARDIWFVVAVPVFLDDQLGWSFTAIGAFLALWVIGYGMVQTVAPRLTGTDRVDGARKWSVGLASLTTAIAVGVSLDRVLTVVVVAGLVLFGVVFAVNSSIHSFLVLAYSQRPDGIAMDVGVYYSANALGRLVGTLLSGLLALWNGLAGALWGSAAFVIVAAVLTFRLPALAAPQTDSATPEESGR